jgi:hypothetical protein
MSQLLGVGAQLKEDKIVDHRPGATPANNHSQTVEVEA